MDGWQFQIRIVTQSHHIPGSQESPFRPAVRLDLHPVPLKSVLLILYAVTKAVTGGSGNK